MPPDVTEQVVTVPATLDVPKESKEVLDSALGLVEHFRKGGDLAGAALLLPSVLQAVEGHEKIGAEIKSAYKADLLAYAAKKVGSALGL